MTLPQFVYSTPLLKVQKGNSRLGGEGISAYPDDVEGLELMKLEGNYLWRVLLESCGVFPHLSHTGGKERDVSQFASSIVRQTLRGLLRRLDMYCITTRVSIHSTVYVNGDPRAVSFDNQGHSGIGSD